MTFAFVERFFSTSRLPFQLSRFILGSSAIWKSSVSSDPHGEHRHRRSSEPLRFLRKRIKIPETKFYLFKSRLYVLLSALAHFGVDKVWFLTICAFIRSFVAFELRKLSLISRFLAFFSPSHGIVTCACWFAPVPIIRLLLLGGWICCCWLANTRSLFFAVCVIKCRLRRMLGSPLCVMK